MNYKLGSLFDGSGGFPLAGALCGVEPVWAAEVEPYPIAVTRSRFPNMKHLGDISKVNGDDIEPVDIITFGSPCQDLSVAGKRAGLKHEANGDEETTRSGLFMEAVRIIKEMRRATNGKYPSMAIWENVPGAFSSNNGEDFRIVCEELIKIVEPSASMPSVPKNGWNYADSYVGDGWSLAYRVFDAQYWGVPQRRRRIYLVADFRGECAREVLFEREGLRGYFAEGRTPWQATPADAERSLGADDREGEGFDRYNQCLTGYVSATLRAPNGGDNCACVIERGRQLDDVIAIDKESYTSGEGWDRAPGISVGGPCATLQTSGTPHAVCYSIENHPADSRVNIDDSGKVQTLTSRMGTGGGNVPMVMETLGINILQDPISTENIAPCLSAGSSVGSASIGVAYGLDRASFNQGQNAKYDFTVLKEQEPTLLARGPGAVRYPVLHASKASYFMRASDGAADTLVATDYKDPQLIAYWDGNKTVGTLTVNNAGGTQRMPDKGNFNCVIEQKPHYIVRRLTPTECARLQGFADWWAYIEPKDSLTEEEYRFWLEVRNTHARINGKKVQEYTAKQMLTWYNKLWTDSAEYKMWGNGIALPTALYCVQGVVEALMAPIEAEFEECDSDDWMN